MSFKASHALSGTPLRALNAVVLDTETTGLNPLEDRVIEIGAVRLALGKLVAGQQFDEPVHPGVPISPQSTKIHGLHDADVALAKSFPGVMRRFGRWADDALLIGFSLGFDLAVLKAEHQRHGLKWSPPRWLDVAHLVQLLSPNLPNNSLETIAHWLGVEVQNRHRALADARLTAQLFVLLLPRLHQIGIVTLSQAERASSSLGSRMSMEVSAGWDEQHWVNRPTRELALIDSFPYRYSVADVMSSKPHNVSPDLNLASALSLLMQHKTSSVFYATGTDSLGSTQTGICTERDLLRSINQHGAKALDMPVSKVGHAPLLCIGKDELVYRAMGMMTRHKLRHLGVKGNSGTIIGAITTRDLLKQRSGDAVNLGYAIQHANSQNQLAQVWTALTQVVQSLHHELVDVRDIAALISRELCELSRRACELALDKMDSQPPCPFALMVLGSGGRGESLLAMDQDNALVYDHPHPAEVDPWFARLSELIADVLDAVGVCYCKGGVMAKNAEWRNSVQGWEATVDSWVSRANRQDFLHCDIFFDAISVYGEERLVTQLLDKARCQASESRTFIKFFAIKCQQFGSPLGMFGRFKLNEGRLDCKLNGLLPIISAARFGAIRHLLPQRSTPKRLKALQKREPGVKKSCINLTQAHRILLEAILNQQLVDITNGLALSNRIDPSLLNSFEKEQLRWAFGQIDEVSNLLDAPVV